jgi:hypothetical protein
VSHLGVLLGLEHKDAGALGHHEPGSVLVEGPARPARVHATVQSATYIEDKNGVSPHLVGSSLKLVVTALMALKPAKQRGVIAASVPPVTIASAWPHKHELFTGIQSCATWIADG